MPVGECAAVCGWHAVMSARNLKVDESVTASLFPLAYTSLDMPRQRTVQPVGIACYGVDVYSDQQL